MTTMPTLVLGRDGMGENATETDFDAWTAFVCAHIDEACGFEVGVETRQSRDVQTDKVVGADEDQRTTVKEACGRLWERWCSEGATGVENKLTKFVITSSAGVDMGTYEGATWLHAIAAMHRDAGYKADVIDGELRTSAPAECGDASDLTVREA